MFVKVKDIKGHNFLLNIDSIVWIGDGNTICTNGIHGDGNGLLTLDNDSKKFLLEVLESEIIEYAIDYEWKQKCGHKLSNGGY